MKYHRYLATATEVCLTVIITAFFYTVSPASALANETHTDSNVETRSVKEFNVLSIQSGVKVVFEQSSEHKLKIEAHPDIKPYLKIAENNGHLTLGLENGIRKFSLKKLFNKAPVTFTLSAPTPESIEINGAGKFEAALLASDSVQLSVHGSGKVDVGQIISKSTSKILVSGSGDTKITKVETPKLEVQIQGFGDIELGAISAKQFETSISGSGDIQYGFVDASDARFNISGSGNITVGEIETVDFKASIWGSGLISAKGITASIQTHKVGSGHFSISQLVKANKQTLNFEPLNTSKTLYL